MTVNGDSTMTCANDCDGCALGFAAVEWVAEVTEVPVEGVVIAHVRGTDTWRSYALGFRPDLTVGS